MFNILVFGKNLVKEENEMPTYNKIKETTLGSTRGRTIAAGAFVVILAVTIAITAIAIAINNNRESVFNEPQPVASAVVFAAPLAQYTSVLKGCSLTELQYNETMRRWEAHKMVTLEAPLGTAVLATYGGQVSDVRDHTLYGRQVTIDHGRDGLKTVLSNLSTETLVHSGDTVTKGQKIGSVGQTSNVEFTKTPHLRIEVYKNGKRIDPNDYIDFPIK
jgi:murein DD-endopeptidase MepM/ murein hydrolase activator NlpD